MIDWEKLLGVWLSLPFDRSLDPATAQERAVRYLQAAGLEPKEEWLDIAQRSVHDVLASTPVDWDTPHPPLAGQDFPARHPLSGTPYTVTLPPCEPDVVAETIHSIVDGLSDPKLRTLALWRLLPERLAKRHAGYDLIPVHADLPSIPVWPVIDCAAALGSIEEKHLHAVDIGGVQQFVAASRTTRDLWAASFLSSLLMLWAVEGHSDEWSPLSVIFPALRGNPLFDLLLRQRLGEDRIALPERQRLLVSSLPNAALLVGFSSTYLELPTESFSMDKPLSAATARLRERLARLSELVRTTFDRHIREHLPPDMVEAWDRAFEPVLQGLPVLVATQGVLPEKPPVPESLSGKPELETLHELIVTVGPETLWGGPEYVPSPQLRVALEEIPGGSVVQIDTWQDAVHVLNRRLHGLKRTQRPLKQAPGAIAAPKCSNCGVREQVGPLDFDRSREFWQRLAEAPPVRGVRFGIRDRLCAEDLAKRLLPTLEELEPFGTVGRHAFPDMATIAALDWLNATQGEAFEINPDEIRQEHGYWSGEWLHWPTSDFDPDEPACPPAVFDRIRQARAKIGFPPVYAAVVASDGDDMGRWLEGSGWPAVRELVSEAVASRLEDLAQGASANPPCTGPVQQSLFSAALSNYAVGVVPEIVKRHGGTLVYAGGDDSLVFAPAAHAAALAHDLYRAFRGEIDEQSPAGFVRSGGDGRLLFVPGPRATASCGIAIAHYKESLRFVLAQARAAQKWAKECGRDLLAIALLRRSGEHTRALCPWPFTRVFEGWVEAFRQKASDRWVYRVYRDVEPLACAGEDAFRAVLKRELKRSDEATRKLFGGPEAIAAAFDTYRALLENKPLSRDEAARGFEVARNFMDLLLVASFLTRTTAEART